MAKKCLKIINKNSNSNSNNSNNNNNNNNNNDNNNNNNNDNTDNSNNDNNNNNNDNNKDNNNTNTKRIISDALRTKQELRWSHFAKKINGLKTLSIFGKRIRLRCASCSYATKSYMTKCS